MTGVPLARFALQQAGQADSLRIVYNSSKRPIAVYDSQGRLLARYHYNGQGERIAKTVYASDKSGLQAVSAKPIAGHTTYSLYQNQRLAADADETGRITAHYVYLNGKPITKIDMQENTSIGHKV